MGWNDSVAKLIALTGASKEAAEEALHTSGGDVQLAIDHLLTENKSSKTDDNAKKPPSSAPEFIDDATSNAVQGCQTKGIIDDDDDDDLVATTKPRETPTYSPLLRSSAATTAKKRNNNSDDKKKVSVVMACPPILSTASITDDQSSYMAVLKSCATNDTKDENEASPSVVVEEGLPRPCPPLQPLPGAVHVGGDDDEDENGSHDDVPSGATHSTIPSPNSLPIAAELSKDVDAVMAERDDLERQVQKLEQERNDTIGAVAVEYDENNEKVLHTDLRLFGSRNPKNAVSGVSSGTKSIVKGVFVGSGSLLLEPVIGAQNNGIKGLAKGCAMGVGKAGALPVAGVAVGCYQIGRGTANSVANVISRGSVGGGSSNEEEDEMSTPSEGDSNTEPQQGADDESHDDMIPTETIDESDVEYAC